MAVMERLKGPNGKEVILIDSIDVLRDWANDLCVQWLVGKVTDDRATHFFSNA